MPSLFVFIYVHPNAILWVRDGEKPPQVSITTLTVLLLHSTITVVLLLACVYNVHYNAYINMSVPSVYPLVYLVYL